MAPWRPFQTHNSCFSSIRFEEVTIIITNNSSFWGEVLPHFDFDSFFQVNKMLFNYQQNKWWLRFEISDFRFIYNSLAFQQFYSNWVLDNCLCVFLLLYFTISVDFSMFVTLLTGFFSQPYSFNLNERAYARTTPFVNHFA